MTFLAAGRLAPLRSSRIELEVKLGRSWNERDGRIRNDGDVRAPGAETEPAGRGHRERGSNE